MMIDQETLVLKFGGASVATPSSFSHVAALIDAKLKQGKKVVVVVSAMGNQTNELIAMAHLVNPNPPKREYDMLVTVGERISIALLAMALFARGVEAISFTGSQAGIITSSSHTEASIIDVRPFRLLAPLSQGKVVIVAGFQGVSFQGEITTLGRGGSDTTAVALAVALQAAAVEFYKDVPGIFSSDPQVDKSARQLPSLSYREALAIVEAGAKVLHARSILLAEKNGLPLYVRSFLEGATEKTVIGQEAERGKSPSYEENHEIMEVR